MASYTLGTIVTGQQWNLGNALKSTFFGAVSGAVTFGIGELFEISSMNHIFGEAKFLIKGIAHSLAQGTLSLMQGERFMSSAVSGFFGSLGAEAWGGLMNGANLEKFASSTIGTISFGALSGGVGAELTGGNFWNGAIIGGIVSGLNHVAHLTSDFLQKKDAELLVLLDSEGASKLGHMALLGGNDEKGWTYVSKDGKLDSDGNPFTTGPSSQTKLDKNIDPAFATKAGALSKLGKYEQWLSFKTSYSNVMKGLDAAYQHALTYYNAASSSCADTVIKGLNAAGFPKFSGWDVVPNARFRQMRENYFGFRTPDYYNNYFHR